MAARQYTNCTNAMESRTVLMDPTNNFVKDHAPSALRHVPFYWTTMTVDHSILRTHGKEQSMTNARISAAEMKTANPLITVRMRALIAAYPTLQKMRSQIASYQPSIPNTIAVSQAVGLTMK